MKKGFTLAEAVLTMTILGILAAVMITTLKPQQYRAQAYRALKEKAYANIDEVTQTLISDCTINFTLANIYADCKNKSSKSNHGFGIDEAATYALYMRGTAGANGAALGKCTGMANNRALALKNGVCLYFRNAYSIFVDVNGSEGPNDGSTDQFTVSINATEGVSSDMP